ncbi:Hypothetical protein CINCED_3A017887 [Cinara cedri]|uniref:Uncharacterized protein n=1 Tax=Cinara cedri TaxID=506608 RepID=A0A5E4MWF6_9HEMI|nr:Hypothetical protein CINCED_3A017887 [Cinara cedri]
MRSTCLYCHNVTFNTVNGRELALHILNNHQFATLEVGSSQVVAERLKLNLNYLENVFCSNQEHIDLNDNNELRIKVCKVIDEPKILLNKWIIPCDKDKVNEEVDELSQINYKVDELPQIKIKHKRFAHQKNVSLSQPEKRKNVCDKEEIFLQTMKKQKITVHKQDSSKNVMPSNNDILQQNKNQLEEMNTSCDEDEVMKNIFQMMTKQNRIARKQDSCINPPKKTKIACDEKQTQNEVDQWPQIKRKTRIAHVQTCSKNIASLNGTLKQNLKPREKGEGTSYNNIDEPQLPGVSVNIQKRKQPAKPQKGKSKLMKIKYVLNKYNPNGR